jgi:hypothetical protein|tara:strand:- start:29160 stop:29921 length:762 start_codon:yes stop_codon:yes gene_type:complete
MATGIGVGIAGDVFQTKAGLGSGPAAFSNLYSMYFDGVSESLVGSAVPLLGAGGTGDFSISFWIYVDTVISGTNQRVFSFGAGGTLQTQMYINAANGNLQFNGPFNDSFAWGASGSTWYHMVFRVNRASATLNVGFVQDGTIINNKSQTVTTTFDTTGDFYMGRNAGSFGFDGNLDEFAVWDKYLTDADCIEIYNSGTPNDLSTLSMAANLQHWWRMGDPTGTASYPTIVDQTGGITMTMTNMDSSNITTNVP